MRVHNFFNIKNQANNAYLNIFTLFLPDFLAFIFFRDNFLLVFAGDEVIG